MSDNNKESKLDKLKKNYKIIREKHNLPSFEEMNRDFSIEKIAEIETDFLLREIRKFVSDRIFAYMRYIENLLNPTNASIFVFSMTKTLTEKEKRTLNEIYKELSKNEIKLMKVDLKYSEEKEAEFIRKGCELWEKISQQFIEILETIEKNWDNKMDVGGKSYFG
ncbi:hypothetical protein J4407_00645 [Candidatus Pacearchaeota archaeon]|nr:hypothetical protein [Candidatus Pacearchaeota archaeon]